MTSEKDTGAPKINIMVTGMDAAGELYREQVSATIAEGGQYSFSIARPLRVRDSVLIEFPTARAGEKPRKIAARVMSIQAGADPDNPKEIRLQPEALMERPPQAGEHAPAPPAPVVPKEEPAAPAPAAGVVTPPPPTPAGKTSAPPAPSAPAARVAAPPSSGAEPKAPLLEAVRADAAEAMYRDLLRRLAADAHTISVELGRKVSKELSDHTAGLTAALSSEAQNQMKLIHTRVDELQHLWDSLRATFEKERALLEEIHRGKLQAFRDDVDILAEEAGKKVEKFRAAQIREQQAIEAHVQQAVRDSVHAATREVATKAEEMAVSAAKRAREQIQTQESAQERQWQERTTRLQGKLDNFLAQLDVRVQQADSALQALQAAAQQAEEFGSRLQADASRAATPPPAAEQRVSFSEQLQNSLATAREAFRQRMADISQVLENSLQASKFPAIPEEERSNN